MHVTIRSWNKCNVLIFIWLVFMSRQQIWIKMQKLNIKCSIITSVGVCVCACLDFNTETTKQDQQSCIHVWSFILVKWHEDYQHDAHKSIKHTWKLFQDGRKSIYACFQSSKVKTLLFKQTLWPLATRGQKTFCANQLLRCYTIA